MLLNTHSIKAVSRASQLATKCIGQHSPATKMPSRSTKDAPETTKGPNVATCLSTTCHLSRIGVLETFRGNTGNVFWYRINLIFAMVGRKVLL